MNFIFIILALCLTFWAFYYFDESARKKRDKKKIHRRLLAQLSKLYGNDGGWILRKMGSFTSMGDTYYKYWNNYFLHTKTCDLNSKSFHDALTKQFQPQINEEDCDCHLLEIVSATLPKFARAREWMDKDDDLWTEEEYEYYVIRLQRILAAMKDDRATESDLENLDLQKASLTFKMNFLRENSIEGFFLSCITHNPSNNKLLPCFMIPNNDLPPHGKWRLVLYSARSDRPWVFDTPYQAKLFAISLHR
ncbi:MAG: hypothetical protein HC820_05285 [Hydrococcus sp. RM1_1_31]|nr:hypothetical protein [Hydrococcus sp. RM1_1_31]